MKEEPTLTNTLAKLVGQIDPALAEYIKAYQVPEPAEPKPHPLKGLPAGTKVWVHTTFEDSRLRYFERMNGDTIATSDGMIHDSDIRPLEYWPHCTRIAENEPRPWFGGKCPVPGWVKVKIWLRDGTSEEFLVEQYRWNHKQYGAAGYMRDVVAYQILEQEVPPNK